MVTTLRRAAPLLLAWSVASTAFAQATPEAAAATDTAPAQNSAWSQAVERASEHEAALETDEERERREERLGRDDHAPLVLPDPVARFGVRADLGGLAYSHDSGALLLGLGGVLVVPVDPRAEFFVLPSFLGGIDPDSGNGVYGAGVDLGVRLLLKRFYIGVGGHAAALVVDTCGDQSFGSFGEECVRDELIASVDGLVTAGGFLNPQRTLELGVTGRVGSETGYGNVTAYVSAHIAYFWAL